MPREVILSTFIGFKCRPEERAALESEAQSQGLSLSMLLRTRLLGGAPSPQEPVKTSERPAGEKAERRRPHVERLPQRRDPVEIGAPPAAKTSIPSAEDPRNVRAPKRTWADEWRQMDQMEQAEAVARFKELAAGRQPPAGFRSWSLTDQIKWLDRSWPI